MQNVLNLDLILSARYIGYTVSYVKTIVSVGFENVFDSHGKYNLKFIMKKVIV